MLRIFVVYFSKKKSKGRDIVRYYKHNTPYSAQEKLRALMLWKRSSTEFVCHRYHCSERSLWRWKSLYDGTLESLENKSSRPHSVHPKAHTTEERDAITRLYRRNPGIGLNELYGKLRERYGYTRSYITLYTFLKKQGVFSSVKRSSYTPKPYNTPEHIGEKMQLDVKFVPNECKARSLPGSERFYQYTIIDEATRKRFIFAYNELSGYNTVDFVKRAIRFFGYTPKMIQTDNGTEFTFTRQTREDREHYFDTFCREHNIVHKLIKPRTPRHNGKVERSHRSDNERFYRYLKFYSLHDLQVQMSAYLNRSNRIPMRTLGWISPEEKNRELMLRDFGISS